MEGSTVLVQLNQVQQALAKVRSVDEAKDIRDKAQALKYYVKQQGYSLEIQNDVAEIKLRAERRAGELLAERDRALAGRPPENRFQDETYFRGAPTLSDLGIGKTQDHRWRTEASLPEANFEKYVASTKGAKRELTSSGLYRLAKRRKRELERKSPGVIDPISLDSVRLICGDFAEVARDLADNSFDAIITDPPYPKEYLHLYRLLAEEAAKLLKPGGSLLAMAGQSYLPDVFNLMTPHLTYQWTLAYLTPGGQSPQIWPRKVNAFWKPVLWFIKGDYVGNWHGDVFKSDVNDNDKRFHEWGQSESGIARLVESFTSPGDLVLDPFVGGGTTAVVCHNLGREFVGIDIDKAQIAITQGRLGRIARGGS